MSRPKKPIDQQKGNITTITQVRRKAEEQSVKLPANQVLRPPVELLVDDTAVAEWRRVVKEMRKIDIVGNLDRANLIGYCNAYALYQRYIHNVDDTDSLREARQQANLLLSFGKRLGMDPDSRLKLATVKREKQESTLEAQFGTI